MLGVFANSFRNVVVGTRTERIQRVDRVRLQKSEHAWFSHSLTLFRFPLGAGSSGVRLYVTVRVTTW